MTNVAEVLITVPKISCAGIPLHDNKEAEKFHRVERYIEVGAFGIYGRTETLFTAFHGTLVGTYL